MRAIIGPNGAGKTTMMDVVTGKTRPDAGDVYFDGTVDLTRLDEAAIAELGIGRKFQKPTVFESHTVWDNLELALAGRRGPFAALFRRADAGGRRSASSEILDIVRLADRRDVSAAYLSHGQKQWLEIGMLLAQEPKLLLVDEPAAGMTDAETEATAELLKEIAKEQIGRRRRARHGLRPRPRRQGDRAARRLGPLRRHASTTSRPTRASIEVYLGTMSERMLDRRATSISTTAPPRRSATSR